MTAPSTDTIFAWRPRRLIVVSCLLLLGAAALMSVEATAGVEDAGPGTAAVVFAFGAVLVLPVFALTNLVVSALIGVVVSAVDRHYSFRRMYLVVLSGNAFGVVLGAGAWLAGSASWTTVTAVVSGSLAIAWFRVMSVRHAGVNSRAANIVAVVWAVLTLAGATWGVLGGAAG